MMLTNKTRIMVAEYHMTVVHTGGIDMTAKWPQNSRDCAPLPHITTDKLTNQFVFIPGGGALSGNVPIRLISKTKTNPLKAL